MPQRGWLSSGMCARENDGSVVISWINPDGGENENDIKILVRGEEVTGELRAGERIEDLLRVVIAFLEFLDNFVGSTVH